jgi:hypothetical protein
MSGAVCVCGETREMLIFPLGVHATVMQEDYFAFFFVQGSIQERPMKERTSTCTYAQIAKQPCGLLRLWVTLKLVWK